MKKHLADIIKVLFFLGLGILFIWLFVRNLTTDEKGEIIHYFTQAQYGWILVSMLFGIVSHLSRTARWQIMLEPMGYKPGFKNVCFALFTGYFANLAVPRLGEVSRCGILAKYEKIPLQKGFGTVVTERAIDVITFGLLFFTVIALQIDKLDLFRQTTLYAQFIGKYQQAESPALYLYLLSALFIGIIYLLYRNREKLEHLIIYQKIKNVIKGFLEGIRSLASIKRPVAFFIHTITIWAMYVGMTWVVFFALPETAGLTGAEALTTMVLGSIGIMVVQGGIGIYPLIVAETLAVFGLLKTTGYAMGWLMWTGQTVMIIMAGVISLILLPILNRKNYETVRDHPVEDFKLG